MFPTGVPATELGPSGFPVQPPPKLSRVIVWFRRDLRVEDNPALISALQLAEEVVPVYIYSPEEEGQFQPGRCSRWWLTSSLESLSRDLAALGSRLLFFRAPESPAALCALAQQFDAQAVMFNHLYDPISMVRDNEAKAALAAAGVLCRSFNGDVLREPWSVVDSAGRPFTSFGTFWEAHRSGPAAPQPPLPAPQRLPAVPDVLQGVPLEELGIMSPEEEMSNSQLQYHWQPGRKGGQRALRDFVEDRLPSFDADRSKTDRNSTSKLSPHIHFGEISARTVHASAMSKRAEWTAAAAAGTAAPNAGSVDDFLRQLGYREYSRYLSFHFPFTHERSLLEHLRAVPWRLDQSLFKAWRQGTTGIPLVDAGMREVWSTGWMHNRIRVVAASFLVKHLLLPWQWGLKHYWDALLDADLECDALGWQYCAGCLADANPFSYTMDLAAEAKRFDPDGNYVRRWLPVLARLPALYIHAPWDAPPRVLADAGVELGVNYPFPVVSKEESEAALAAAVEAVERSAATGGATATAVAAVAPASTGPYRPATASDPGASARAWGGSGSAAAASSVPGYSAAAGAVSAPAVRAATRRGGAEGSLRGSDSEEVVSNNDEFMESGEESGCEDHPPHRAASRRTDNGASAAVPCADHQQQQQHRRGEPALVIDVPLGMADTAAGTGGGSGQRGGSAGEGGTGGSGRATGTGMAAMPPSSYPGPSAAQERSSRPPATAAAAQGGPGGPACAPSEQLRRLYFADSPAEDDRKGRQVQSNEGAHCSGVAAASSDEEEVLLPHKRRRAGAGPKEAAQ